MSRILEIDASTGPRYGLQQYKDNDFLKPGEVVLTFDDGPARAHTQVILDALDAQCTKATFFMVGSMAVADPDMVRKVVARGHTVGFHTWSHADLQKESLAKGREEIELGLSAVTAAAGQPIAPFFRFPYLAHTKATLAYTKTRGFGVFSIDIDSNDWKTRNAVSINRDVLAQLAEQGKGVILMHDIHKATADALPTLLEALRVKGYHVVQLRPKALATTLAEFDALARDVHARKQVAALSQPLVKHRMTWGAAEPGVMARLPQSASVHRSPAGSYPDPSPPRPAVGTAPSPSAGLSTNAAAAPPVGDAFQPATQFAHQHPPANEDWRDKVFGR